MSTPLEELRSVLHRRIGRGLDPVARALARLGVLPNQVTVAGAVLSLIAAGLIAGGRLLPAGLVWLAAAVLDLVDGVLARHGNRATSFGAFLDSTLDRVSEGVVLAAIAYRLAAHTQPAAAALVVLAMLGSVLVSYTRARAEALGAQCKVGVLTRAERVLIIGLGLCLDALIAAVWALVVLSLVTVVQRVLHIRQQLRP